jgi:SAM-dependent methyltransferase
MQMGIAPHDTSNANFVDATARKPSRLAGRFFYQYPKPHYRSFEYLLDNLLLTSDDKFLDICCGGGGLLIRALQTVHQAAGLDHSPDMVTLTKKNNARAILENRLDVRQGDACNLSWDNATFDAAANTNALFFLSNPVQFFHEVYRVLKTGGRFAVITAPKRKIFELLFAPWRSSMNLYTKDELSNMLLQAGFIEVESYSPDGQLLIGYGIKR